MPVWMVRAVVLNGQGEGTREVSDIWRRFQPSRGESVLLASGREKTRAQLDILQCT